MCQGFAIALIALLPEASAAATFSLNCTGEAEVAKKGCSVALRGEIKKGDAEKFQKILASSRPAGWHIDTLLLDSNGGDVRESFLLANLVRKFMLNTSTTDLSQSLKNGRRGYAGMSKAERQSAIRQEHFTCVSACFLVWLAGARRQSINFGDDEFRVGIGLHRPYFGAEFYRQSPDVVAKQQQQIMAEVKEYLVREQVPAAFIEEMMKRSSVEVYWVSQSEDWPKLNGRAPWFEEMMIARCGLDPKLDDLLDRRLLQLVAEEKKPDSDSEYMNLLSKRQAYNVCEYQQRQSAHATKPAR